MYRKLMLVFCVIIVFAGTPVNAGTWSWLQGVELEMSLVNFPSVTQSTNPLSYQIDEEEGVLHDKPLEMKGSSVLALGLRVPFYLKNNYTWGAYAEYLVLGDHASEGYHLGGHQLGIYVNAPLDSFMVTSWAGLAQRSMVNSGYIDVKGKGSAFTFGFAFKATLHPVILQVGLEHTRDVIARDLRYYLADQPWSPGSGYAPPPIRFVNNTSIRMGLGVKLN